MARGDALPFAIRALLHSTLIKDEWVGVVHEGDDMCSDYCVSARLIMGVLTKVAKQ